jgi:diadenosine tetraphosphatase ApaH/serine/threonine PP2A family protein phosphatase
MQSFMPEPGDDEGELLAGVTDRRLVFGHTHLQFRRTRDDGRELVNPGSVGLPFDGDARAAYALVEADGSLELRRVAYDRGRTIAALRERFGGRSWSQRSISRLETAQP